MLDTHSNAADKGYDNLWDNQISWYKWAVNGIKAENGGETVQSTVFMHIPVVEFNDAWNVAYNEDAGEYNPEYAEDSFGLNGENVCSAKTNNGFFDVCKELGSTKDMVVGHDHVNCSSILYKGIRLSYGLKTGSGCYWREDMNGGSTLTISSDGSAKFEHHYVDPATVQLSDAGC